MDIAITLIYSYMYLSFASVFDIQFVIIRVVAIIYNGDYIYGVIALLLATNDFFFFCNTPWHGFIQVKH